MRLADFGRIMRKYRMSHGMTQEDLGHLLGIGEAYIGFLENNHRSPSPDIQNRMEGLLSQDNWGNTLLLKETVSNQTELTLAISLYKRLRKVHPALRNQCLDLIYYILDVMNRSV